MTTIVITPDEILADTQVTNGGNPHDGVTWTTTYQISKPWENSTKE